MASPEIEGVSGPPVAVLANSSLHSIVSSSGALALFKDLNNNIPLDELKNGTKQLHQHQDIKNHLQNAKDTYFMSSQSIYECCGRIINRFESYLRFFNDLNKAKATLQQRILISVLEEAIEKFTAAQQKHEETSGNFSMASEKIAAITDLNLDGLKQAIDSTISKISETNPKLKDQIRAIVDVKTQAQMALNTIVDIEKIEELSETIQNQIKIPVEKLIEECKTYRERHIAQKETFDQADEILTLNDASAPHLNA